MLPMSYTGPWSRTATTATTSTLLVDRGRRTHIDKGLPTFPEDLVNLIADYDTELCVQPFRFDEHRNLLNSAENRAIGSAIQSALISRDVDPKIKRQILVNVIESKRYPYRKEFNRLLRELHGKDLPVVLDNTDLSGLNMINIQFGMASAVNIDLSKSTLHFVNLAGARLTNANLKEATLTAVTLVNADLYGAYFEKTRFEGCRATNLTTNDKYLRQLVIQVESDLFLDGARNTSPSHLQTLPIRLTQPPDDNCAIA